MSTELKEKEQAENTPEIKEETKNTEKKQSANSAEKITERDFFSVPLFKA